MLESARLTHPPSTGSAAAPACSAAFREASLAPCFCTLRRAMGPGDRGVAVCCMRRFFESLPSKNSTSETQRG
eukprot:scaffold92919_cov48-Phaeocystis_antarctica.AAC.3